MAYESAGAMVAKSIIDNSIKEVTRNKDKIPSEKLFDILRNEQYMKELRPLIADAVLKASSIDGLMYYISNLLKDKKNEALTEALQKLQNKLQSIYEGKEPRARSKGGRKRRRTNKRKNYKKRRSTKHR